MKNQQAPITPLKIAGSTTRQSKAQPADARTQSMVADYLAKCTPEQRRIQEKLQAMEIQPKIVPPFRSLRECIVSTLNCAEIVMLLEAETTETNVDVFNKLLTFDLWEAYRKQIKVIPDFRVLRYYRIAATSRDPQCRSTLKHVAVVMAIKYLASDPSLITEREQFELGIAIGSDGLARSNRYSKRL